MSTISFMLLSVLIYIIMTLPFCFFVFKFCIWSKNKNLNFINALHNFGLFNFAIGICVSQLCMNKFIHD